jgi:hypothetical protein
MILSEFLEARIAEDEGYIPHFMWDPWTGRLLPTKAHADYRQEWAHGND